MLRKKGITRLALCAGVLCAFLASCSRAAPQISFGFLSLAYYEEQDAIKERFSFFIIPEDDDGIENLADLYLYSDNEQLRWHLKNGDWVTFPHNNKTWIGSWSLSMEGDEPFPRGQYRAVLINKGGEKSERNFTFDAPAENRLPFPTLEISGDTYTVTSEYPDNYLVCYGEDGTFFSSVMLTSLSGSINDLGLDSGVRIVSLWANEPEYFVSALTEATNLRQ